MTDAGAVSVLRWHALSGYSLRLTQETGGRVTIDAGTGALLARDRRCRAVRAPASTRPSRPSPTRPDGVEVTTRDGDGVRARAAIVAVPLNALGAIEFDPALPEDKQAAIALGQASRGIKLMLRVRGERAHAERDPTRASVRLPGTEELDGDGTQLMIGFGPDAERCDAADLRAVQRQLDAILPGYELLGATAHDWLADEFSRGTWAIHRPGWYEHHHAAMRRPEPGLMLRGLGPGQRVGRVHRRRDRVRAARGAAGGSAERLSR